MSNTYPLQVELEEEGSDGGTRGKEGPVARGRKIRVPSGAGNLEPWLLARTEILTICQVPK